MKYYTDISCLGGYLRKIINNDLQNITQKAKDKATRTPIKTGGKKD
jgi:hypothetical protein